MGLKKELEKIDIISTIAEKGMKCHLNVAIVQFETKLNHYSTSLKCSVLLLGKSFRIQE